MTNIGKNISSYRRKLVITQEELAEKLNVTRQAVSNWENGKTEPDIETLTRIAQIFDISIDELVDGIPKGITELRGKKNHLKFGIIFTSVYIVSSIIYLMMKEPINNIIGSTYDMFLSFFCLFFWKPLTAVCGGLGISLLLSYGTVYTVKNKKIRIALMVFGILFCLLTTIYLFYCFLCYMFGLNFIIPVGYYIFLMKNPVLHAIWPILLTFGFIKK